MQSRISELPRPEYVSQDRSFQLELNRRVSAYFRNQRISPKATPAVIAKGLMLYVCLLGLYLSFFFFTQTFASVFGLATVTAVVLFLIGMNVMHDSAHGTLFKKPLLTKLAYCTWDFFGVSGDMYRVKHNEVHHGFTNITAWDGDMDLPYPYLRLNPHQQLLPRHRYQKYFAPFMYSLVTLSWIFFADLAAIKSRRVCNYRMQAFKRRTILKVVIFKLANLALFIGLPSLYFGFGHVLLTFIYVQLLLGFMLSLIFQVAHINEKTKFVLSEDGLINEDWAVHQLQTSSNFATGSRFWKFALGGLNYQIEHHLFPAICHVHYPEIRRIVRELCREKNLPYHEYPTFQSAINSHFRLLHQLGRNEAS